jgi:excisionase family DNA binding protein
MPMPIERRWIPPREAAEYLNIHLMTVYAWIDSGKLPAAHIGRLIRVDLCALEAYLERQSLGKTAATNAKVWGR